MPAKINWSKVRQIIKSWLQMRDKSQRELARLAELNVSLISKFINHETDSMKLESTLKLYRVIRNDLPLEVKRDFLEASGLQDLLEIQEYTPHDSHSPEGINSLYSEDNPLQLFLIGSKLKHKDWKQALAFFHAVEEQ